MKYLKIYEELSEGISLQEWMDRNLEGVNPNEITEIDCENADVINLNGVENCKKLRTLWVYDNLLTSLNGIEELIDLSNIDVINNNITNIEAVRNLKNLTYLSVVRNKLENLHGIENLTNLEILYCYDNYLKNLNEIKNLNLHTLKATSNSWEEPIPPKLINKIIYKEIYSPSDLGKFMSYEYQKNFLEEHPERIEYLTMIGFHQQIKEEYKDLIKLFNIKL